MDEGKPLVAVQVGRPAKLNIKLMKTGGDEVDLIVTGLVNFLINRGPVEESGPPPPPQPSTTRPTLHHANKFSDHPSLHIYITHHLIWLLIMSCHMTISYVIPLFIFYFLLFFVPSPYYGYHIHDPWPMTHDLCIIHLERA